MAKQTPRSSDKKHADPFLTDGLDPNILAVPPDDPYTLLLPGVKIEAGDIKRVVGDQQVWTSVEDAEVDHDVPKQGIAYARVTPPEFYRLLERSGTIGENDVCWTDNAMDWVRVPEEWIDTVAGTIIENCRQQNYRCFLATLIDPDNHRMKPIPSHHRVVYPGEKLRRGDKYINKGRIEWLDVPERLSGEVVENQSEQNGFIRYCRPIHHQAQTWYVDPDRGTDARTATGGFEDPFKSLDKAQKFIEEAARKVGRTPFGMICTREGVPMMFYDLPEPAPRAQAADDPQFPEEEQFPEPEMDLEQETERFCRARSLPGDAENIAERSHSTVDEVQRDAQTTLPAKFRLMVAGEETRKGDMWYGPLDGDEDVIMWQACPEELLSLDPAHCAYIFARKKAPKNSNAMLESRLSDVEQQLEAALAVVRELKQELNNGT